MSRETEASVTWSQALAWRMGRQLLDPVGAGSVAGSRTPARRGALDGRARSLSWLSGPAVRRRVQESSSRLLTDGEVIKARRRSAGPCTIFSPEEGGVYLAIRSAGRAVGTRRVGWTTTGLTPRTRPDFGPWLWAALSDGPLTVVELGQALSRHRKFRHLKPVFDEGACR